MTTSITIPNQGPSIPGQDFTLLKDEINAGIQALSGGNWTDFNAHNPGVNFIDASLYALTDLSYRLGFDLPDLLSPQSGHHLKAFLNPSESLSTTPVTQDDYLKICLDNRGIISVALERDPTIPALWVIRANLDSALHHTDELRRQICTQLRNRFLSERGLGDQLLAVHTLSTAPVRVKLSLALIPGADVTSTLADILFAIDTQITPPVTFYDEDSLISQGISGDIVYQGPLLKSGVIDINTLPPSEPPEFLFSSDLIKTIRAQSNVQALEDFQVRYNQEEWQDWSIDIPSGQVISFDAQNSLEFISVKQKDIPVIFDSQAVLAKFAQLKISSLPQLKRASNTHVFPGYNRELSIYRPYQFDLPVHYGLSPQGLGPQASEDAKLSARQAGGYNLLLEQTLANHHAQLDHIKTLLGLPIASQWQTIAEMFDVILGSAALSDDLIHRFWQAVHALPATHCSQAVDHVQYIDELLGTHRSWYSSPAFNQLTEASGSLAQYQRYNRLYSHLLSRINESSIDANTVKYAQSIAFYLEEIGTHPLAFQEDSLERLVGLKSALDKAAMLIDYPAYGQYRSLGLPLLQRESTSKFSGLELRIKRLLGMTGGGFRAVATNNFETLHLIESIQLHYLSGTTPSDESSTLWTSEDAHKVYFVLPQWPSRFADSDINHLIRQTIDQETPVHLTPVILFLDRIQMDIFEPALYAWRQACTVYPVSYHCTSFVKSSVDQMRMQRMTVLGQYLFDLLSAAENNIPLGTITPPNTTDFPVVSIGRIGYDFTVSYKPLKRLIYDPDQVVGIGQASINPDLDEESSPFVVTIRPPHTLS